MNCWSSISTAKSGAHSLSKPPYVSYQGQPTDNRPTQSTAAEAAIGLPRQSFLQDLCGLHCINPALGSALFSLVAGGHDFASYTDIVQFKVRSPGARTHLRMPPRIRCVHYSNVRSRTLNARAIPCLHSNSVYKQAISSEHLMGWQARFKLSAALGAS